jgi:hypothetical protein
LLPTGYGKTLIIASLPYLHEEEKRIIVVSPLNAIINEQSAFFGEKCVTLTEAHVSALKNSSGVEPDLKVKEDLQRLQSAPYILGHPEVLLDAEVKKLLRGQLGKKVNKCLFFILLWNAMAQNFIRMKGLSLVIYGVHCLIDLMGLKV